MSPPWLIVCATFLFATMGVCVKLASVDYPAGEIVFYRGITGALMMLGVARWSGGTVRTRVASMHFWRSLSGVTALVLWFYAIGNLPLATAMTLNYMSSVWMALFLIGGAVALGTSRVDGRLIATVLVGFAAETEQVIVHATDKLARKRCDLIVANDVSAADAGFATDTNRVIFVRPGVEPEVLPLLTKRDVARRILDAAQALRRG